MKYLYWFLFKRYCIINKNIFMEVLIVSEEESRNVGKKVEYIRNEVKKIANIIDNCYKNAEENNEKIDHNNIEKISYRQYVDEHYLENEEKLLEWNKEIRDLEKKGAKIYKEKILEFRVLWVDTMIKKFEIKRIFDENIINENLNRIRGTFENTSGEFKKHKKEMEKYDRQIKEYEEKYKEHDDKIKDHDRNILTMMGIFLAIFSFIGANASIIPKLSSEFTAIGFVSMVSLINGIILLIVMTLFFLIREEKDRWLPFLLIPLALIIVPLGLVLTNNKFVLTDTEKVIEKNKYLESEIKSSKIEMDNMKKELENLKK